MNKRSVGFIISIACGILLLSCSHTTTEPTRMVVDAKQAAKLNIELGLRYLEQGNRARAKEKLLFAQQEYPSAQSYAALAYFYEQTHEWQKAEQYYKKAISFAPNSGAGHNNYGAFLCRHERYNEADKEFNFAINDASYLNTAGAYENAGLCQLMIANDAKAKGYFIKALQHNPNMLTSLEEMARLTDKAGDYPAAREYLNRYVNLNPSSKNVLELGINIAKQLHDKTMLAQYENLLKKSLSNTATNAKN